MLRYLIAFLQCLFMREFWQPIGSILRSCIKLAYWYIRSKLPRSFYRARAVLLLIVCEPLDCCELVLLVLGNFLLTGRIMPE
jgi:hypothetical protein